MAIRWPAMQMDGMASGGSKKHHLSDFFVRIDLALALWSIEGRTKPRTELFLFSSAFLFLTVFDLRCARIIKFIRQ